MRILVAYALIIGPKARSNRAMQTNEREESHDDRYTLLGAVMLPPCGHTHAHAHAREKLRLPEIVRKLSTTND
jgi:type IV secretory pathway VirD2 relaxase